jgi:signal transduction histidine kinase
VLAQNLLAQGSDLAPQADKIYACVNEAIIQSRSLTHGLAPVGISGQGLVYALGRLAEQLSELHHIQCRFSQEDGVDVTASPIALHLYRIAQEAAANAIQHGHAHNVTFSLTKERGARLLSIRDDGSGFVFRDHAPAGLGLRTMRHRAQAIGGIIDIQSSPPQGTEIRCRLPDLAASIADPSETLSPALVP